MTKLRKRSIGDIVRHAMMHGTSWLAHRLVLFTPRKRRRVLGIELSRYMLRSEQELVFFGRVQRALELIARYEPRRLDRIRRDVRTICGISNGPNHYERSGRAIVLTWPSILATPAELAMTIVHEATHGRIADRGIAYLPENRARIETACVRQEAEFARLLPGGEALADAELAKLEKPWWNDEDLAEAAVRYARAEEVPEWLIRFAEWLSRRRTARAGRAS
jgi:hypothetical protein